MHPQTEKRESVDASTNPKNESVDASADPRNEFTNPKNEFFMPTATD